MQKKKYRRMLGYIFFNAAVVGTLFCLLGIIQVWRIHAAALSAAANTYEVVGETLDTTREGLSAIDLMVQSTTENVGIFQTTIQTITLSINDSNTVLDSLTLLTSTDLPAALSATQTSLESAQTSARLIDNMLGGLARLPLLGLDAYQPEVPLGTAIGEISESLEPLSPNMISISETLDGAGDNLDNLETELGNVSETTQQLVKALEDGQAVINDYQEIITDLETRIEGIETATPAAIRSIAWLLTFFLVSLLFAQIGLGERGVALIRKEITGDS